MIKRLIILLIIMSLSLNASEQSKLIKNIVKTSKTIYKGSKGIVTKKRLKKLALLTKKLEKNSKGYIKKRPKEYSKKLSKRFAKLKNKKVLKKGMRKFKTPNFEEQLKNAPNQVGVYVFRKNGKVVYVGRAIENRKGQTTKGLRKRLQEHFRGSRSGKKELFENKDKLNLEIIPLKSASDAIKKETELIKKYGTVDNGWNKINGKL